MDPIIRVYQIGYEGHELGCNSPRRTLRNQTKGRRYSGSCGESKSYKGVNPD